MNCAFVGRPAKAKRREPSAILARAALLRVELCGSSPHGPTKTSLFRFQLWKRNRQTLLRVGLDCLKLALTVRKKTCLLLQKSRYGTVTRVTFERCLTRSKAFLNLR